MRPFPGLERIPDAVELGQSGRDAAFADARGLHGRARLRAPALLPDDLPPLLELSSRLPDHFGDQLRIPSNLPYPVHDLPFEAERWRKLPRQVDTPKEYSRSDVGLGKNVSGGTRPRLSWGRFVL